MSRVVGARVSVGNGRASAARGRNGWATRSVRRARAFVRRVRGGNGARGAWGGLGTVFGRARARAGRVGGAGADGARTARARADAGLRFSARARDVDGTGD